MLKDKQLIKIVRNFVCSLMCVSPIAFSEAIHVKP